MSNYVKEDFVMSNCRWPDEVEEYLADGTVDIYLGNINEGKEANIHLVGKEINGNLNKFVIKVFKKRDRRSFKNKADYFLPITLLPHRREARAIKNKSRMGRVFEEAMWQGREVQYLKLLSEAGADTPFVVREGRNSFMMEFIEDEFGAAPKLVDVRNELKEVKTIFDQILKNIFLFLSLNIVHGDLSAYNILYGRGKITIIDFPQAVDPRNNPNAKALLMRDINNICFFFNKLGARYDADQIFQDFWGEYESCRLKYQVDFCY